MERKVTERIRANFIALDNQKALRLLKGFLVPSIGVILRVIFIYMKVFLR
jgi:hypothetical protein